LERSANSKSTPVRGRFILRSDRKGTPTARTGGSARGAGIYQSGRARAGTILDRPEFGFTRYSNQRAPVFPDAKVSLFIVARRIQEERSGPISLSSSNWLLRTLRHQFRHPDAIGWNSRACCRWLSGG